MRKLRMCARSSPNWDSNRTRCRARNARPSASRVIKVQSIPRVLKAFPASPKPFASASLTSWSHSIFVRRKPSFGLAMQPLAATSWRLSPARARSRAMPRHLPSPRQSGAAAHVSFAAAPSNRALHLMRFRGWVKKVSGFSPRYAKPMAWRSLLKRSMKAVSI